VDGVDTCGRGGGGLNVNGEKTVVGKVGYERACMVGTIKEENLQVKTHCFIEKMRDKEKKLGVNRCF